MLERGAILTLCNRDDSRAQQLASDVRGAFIPYEARNDLAPFDIIINASSRGMSDVDPRSPVPVDALKAQHVVLDAVYKPVETVLVAEARKRGATAIDGSRMLLHQAAAQFELYSGRTAPLAAMDEALRAQLR